MFYTKSRLPGGGRVKTEITDGNVFTKCSVCGRELPVDLAEILSDSEGDLFSTSVVCSRCSERKLDTPAGKSESLPASLTHDGLIWLVRTLVRFGYADEIQELYDLYRVDGPEDLSAAECAGFGSALVRRAIGAEEN